jgi:SulP family sulfate permease
MNGTDARLFALPEWLGELDRRTLRRDAVAGLSVGVMLVPQAMAYATLGGLPPIYGLYASLVPLLVYPIFGTARQLAVGIVALDMLILGAGLAPLAEAGTERYLALAILLAALVGVIQIGMGISRLGMLADLLSRPVVTGFTAAAALVIAASQIGPLVGIDLPPSQFVHEIAGVLAGGLGDVHLQTAALGAASIVTLVALRTWAPRFPRALVVMVAGIGATLVLGLEASGVAVTGEVPRGLPVPAMPELTLSDVRALLPTAVTLALIQLMSAISIGRALSSKHRYTVRPNRELLGLGSANLVGSLFRSVPVSASFSRSAVAEDAGARTPLANVFAAALVVVTLLFLTPLFAALPTASLAAIIVVSVLGLVRPREFVALARTHRPDAALALLTAVATLTLGIREGVLVGIVASTLVVLHRFSRPNVAELGLIPGTHFFRDRERFEEAENIRGVLVLRVDAAFSFFNAAWFRDHLLDRSDDDPEAHSDLHAVVIEARGINDLDTTALDALHELVGTLHARGIQFHLAGLKGRVRDVLTHSPLADELTDDRFHLSSHHAVRHILAAWDHEHGTDRLARYTEVTGDDDGGAPAPDVPLT